MIEQQHEAMLTPEWFPLRHHPVQSDLWRTTKRFVAVYAGRGSGKTLIARRRVVRFLQIKKPWPDPMYFYALPTRDQARRVAWSKLKALVPKHWLATEPSESEMSITTIYGSKLYLVGMDKPQRIEGNQWDGGVIDESSDQKPKSFDLSVRPALSHRNGWCWRIGVPKRTGCGAPDFKEWCLERADVSFTWPSEDILPADEIEAARTQLDPRDFNEQYRASWETASGLVFYAFSDILNVREVQYRPELPLLVGSDFNVDPMAWVVAQVVGDDVHVIDELFIRNANTQMALEMLQRKFASHESGVRFYGDATGRARKTSASESDYVQIRNFTGLKDSRIYYPKSNPPVADRFAACNALFCNAANKRRLFIDPRCKNLKKDLITRAYKPGENVPDDSGDIGHITDALGYLIYYLFPLHVKLFDAPPEVVIVR